MDTRADVYALGVILYELLTGTTPIRRDALRQAALAEVLRLIREDEPPAPSRRLGTSDALPSVAANRRTEPARLGRLVRGDLDWVVMKALEKDRDRRYESAAAFAADVERFLNHEPVSAGPPTAAYRVRKFVRRNRAAVIAAGLVLLALVAGVVGTTWGLVEARGAGPPHAVVERRRADDEAAVAREVNAILTEALVGQADPTARAAAGRAPDPDLKVRALLDAVAARLDGRFAGRPAVEGAVRRTVGRAYRSWGCTRTPSGTWSGPSTWPGRSPRPPAAGTADVAADLATAYRRAGQLDRAERLNREFLDRLESVLGPDDPRVLTFGYNLGLVALDLGRVEEAERRLSRALAGREKAFGADSFPVAEVRNALGGVAVERRDYDRALDLRSRALTVYRRVLSDDAPATLIVGNNVADALARLGRPAEAAEAFERLVADARRSLGPTHVDTLTYLHGLAFCHLDQGKTELAEPLFREAAEAARAALPEDHPDAVLYGYDLGCLYEDTGRYAEADRELADALRRSPPGPPGRARDDGPDRAAPDRRAVRGRGGGGRRAARPGAARPVRGAAAGPLDHVPPPGAAGPGGPGPGPVRRRRAAPAGGIPRPDRAGGEDPAGVPGQAGRADGPPGRTLHPLGQAGGGGEVAGRTGEMTRCPAARAVDWSTRRTRHQVSVIYAPRLVMSHPGTATRGRGARRRRSGSAIPLSIRRRSGPPRRCGSRAPDRPRASRCRCEYSP